MKCSVLFTLVVLGCSAGMLLGDEPATLAQLLLGGLALLRRRRA